MAGCPLCLGLLCDIQGRGAWRLLLRLPNCSRSKVSSFTGSDGTIFRGLQIPLKTFKGYKLQWNERPHADCTPRCETGNGYTCTEAVWVKSGYSLAFWRSTRVTNTHVKTLWTLQLTTNHIAHLQPVGPTSVDMDEGTLRAYSASRNGIHPLYVQTQQLLYANMYTRALWSVSSTRQLKQQSYSTHSFWSLTKVQPPKSRTLINFGITLYNNIILMAYQNYILSVQYRH